MSFPEVIELSDDEIGDAELNVVKQEPGLIPGISQHKEINKDDWAQKQTSTPHRTRQESLANESSKDLSSLQHESTILGQVGLTQTSTSHGTFHQSPPNGNSNHLSTVHSNSATTQGVVGSATNGSALGSKLPPAPLCRQFWKAGAYDDAQASKLQLQGGQNRLLVHPKFLHSNATSHKWAFGAVAELLDNAFDEVQNGASFVMVDKIINPRDGNPALLIHDDGGGMDPESMRRCMSFGFSAKKSESAIGQYGNGFKTSTMRLGADVIVFSRHASKRIMTQSVGLLSYTFLRQTGHDRIVVPMVDYEFDKSTGKLRHLSSISAEHISANISMLVEWSPYGTEIELLNQFDNMGHHGTKVIIYNLWYNDDRELEFDFESDPEDILVTGAPKIIQSSHQGKMISQHHIANRFPYSLRVYSSILYLRVPKNFRIILRGRVVEHHNLADDLKFPEYIVYKPQIGGNAEAAVYTTIGFLKDAPHVNIHGFSVYHKNRLIMPFWRVLNQTNNSRGRGVAGVLEANFIEPTHNKQDFEKTALFQKLETRLKEMSLEYWDFHCGLIGYHQVKKPSTTRVPHSKNLQPVMMNPNSPTLNSPNTASSCRTFQESTNILGRSSKGRQEESVANGRTSPATVQPDLTLKRKGQGNQVETERLKRRATSGETATNGRRHQWEAQPANGNENQLPQEKAENKKLKAECLEYEKKEKELIHKADLLKMELREVQHEYARLLAQSKAIEAAVKDEKT